MSTHTDINISRTCGVSNVHKHHQFTHLITFGIINTDLLLTTYPSPPSNTHIASSAADVPGSSDENYVNPESKVHGANMGPIWGRQDPGGPHVGPMNLAIWETINTLRQLDLLHLNWTDIVWGCCNTVNTLQNTHNNTPHSSHVRVSFVSSMHDLLSTFIIELMCLAVTLSKRLFAKHEVLVIESYSNMAFF